MDQPQSPKVLETGIRTVLFTEIHESASLRESLGPEGALKLSSSVAEELQNQITSSGAKVIRATAHEVLSIFLTAEKACSSACKLHEMIRNSIAFRTQGVALRCGMHTGEVIVREDDVYGDAVNVAARATALAAPDQIITTQATMDSIPIDVEFNSRALGKIPIKGKQQSLFFCELLWKKNNEGSLSATSLQELLFAERRSFLLTLTVGDHTYEFANGSPPITIGRAEVNDVVVRSQSTSRVHASMHFGGGKCTLSDRSTNGLYVIPDDSPVVYVHREEITLVGNGQIHLGRTMDENEQKRISYTLTSTEESSS